MNVCSDVLLSDYLPIPLPVLSFFYGLMAPPLDMVVSGVPQENGINHAGEIASMALDLVSVCHSFKIPHKPDTQLKIRAGIHSGADSKF